MSKPLPLAFRLKQAKVGDIVTLTDSEMPWFSEVSPNFKPGTLVEVNDYSWHPPLFLLEKFGKGLLFGVAVAYESETAVRKIDKAELEPPIVHVENAPDSRSSSRLPEAIYSRYLAGDSIAELATDYRITQEATEWAIELAACRVMLESRPRTKRHQEARQVLVKMGRIEA